MRIKSMLIILEALLFIKPFFQTAAISYFDYFDTGKAKTILPVWYIGR